MGGLRVSLDAPLPARLRVGEGTALFVDGWTCCFARWRRRVNRATERERRQLAAVVGPPA